MARALSGSADSFMKAANGAATAAVAATAPAQLKRNASRALIDVGHVDRYLTERQEQQGRLFCRDHLYVFLHSPTSSFGATAYATCTMLAAVACTAVYFFETVEEYGQKLHPHMQRIDASFLTIFALDIVLRCLAKLGSWRACWRGVISDGLLWVEMLCVAPLIARIAIYPTRTIEIEDSELRVMLQLTEALGVLRLLRTARYYHGAHLLVGALTESVSALRVPFFFLALLCAQFGGIMYVLEYSSDHPDKVQNAPDAMWLILCTVTTVGCELGVTQTSSTPTPPLPVMQRHSHEACHPSRGRWRALPDNNAGPLRDVVCVAVGHHDACHAARHRWLTLHGQLEQARPVSDLARAPEQADQEEGVGRDGGRRLQRVRRRWLGPNRVE